MTSRVNSSLNRPLACGVPVNGRQLRGTATSWRRQVAQSLWAGGLRQRVAPTRRLANTPRVEPDQGTVIGSLRVRLTCTGEEPLSRPIADVVLAAANGPGWEVIVSPADSAEVLAQRSFAHRGDAQQARDKFVRLAGADLVDVSEPKGLERALAGL